MSFVYLIDNTIDGQGPSPRELQSSLLELAPGIRIHTEGFREVSIARVRALGPSHVILSGQSHPWDRYPAGSLSSVFEVIHQASQPILGVCGGHQQIALAFDAPVDLMQRLEEGEGYEGAK